MLNSQNRSLEGGHIAMQVASIQKTSTPELIVQTILRNIQTGDLKPGDRLPPEREMSKAFGVGRSSIREAVSALALVGYLEVTQGKGTYLKADIPAPFGLTSKLSDIFEAQWIFDLIETRKMLESSIVTLATQRAKDRDIKKLRQAIARIKAGRRDIEQFYRADFDFHITISEITRNKVTCELLKVIVEKAHRHYAKFMPDALCRPDRAIRTSEMIVDAMETKDVEKACKAMQSHLDIVNTELMRIIPEARKLKTGGKSRFIRPNRRFET
jgi:GntR family transcriptional repressor for pyruvate dehydrogenase complex